MKVILALATPFGMGISNEQEIFTIGKVIFEISRKNDVHNNYETDYTCGVLKLVNP